MTMRTCPWWLGRTIDNPLRRLMHDPVKLLSPYVQNGMTAADIGCGMGMFSLAMAKMVGNSGRVYSVDIQQKMLDALRKRAAKAGVADRIRLIHTNEDSIGVQEPVDFVLAFWMLHEVKDRKRFFDQIASVLKKTGALLFVEPKMHVTRSQYEDSLNVAHSAGFEVREAPSIRISWAAVLQKP
jgi:ubiquinone/menaquinone biosynthesis C-methylase UbiE